MSNRKIKKLWWEGTVLFMEFDDGHIIKYEGSYITSYKVDFKDNDVLVVEDITPLNFDNTKIVLK